MPLDALALKKVQCAAPVLTVAAGSRDFSEVRASHGQPLPCCTACLCALSE